MRLSFLAAAGFLVISSLAMKASTLASFTAIGGATAVPNYAGEAFTVSGTGPYSSITFNFLTGASTPFAIGTGFLLSTPYAGAPGALGSGTAGYLGSAAASNNEYTFGNNVILQGGSTYYLYENALVPPGVIPGAASSLAGPTYYYAVSGGNFVAQPGLSADFIVIGSSVSATPEPSSFALLGTGLLGVVFKMKRRFA